MGQTSIYDQLQELYRDYQDIEEGEDSEKREIEMDNFGGQYKDLSYTEQSFYDFIDKSDENQVTFLEYVSNTLSNSETQINQSNESEISTNLITTSEEIFTNSNEELKISSTEENEDEDLDIGPDEDQFFAIDLGDQTHFPYFVQSRDTIWKIIGKVTNAEPTQSVIREIWGFNKGNVDGRGKDKNGKYYRFTDDYSVLYPNQIIRIPIKYQK
jgi:hypothetical protein